MLKKTPYYVTASLAAQQIAGQATLPWKTSGFDELIFGLPGNGRALYDAATTRDILRMEMDFLRSKSDGLPFSPYYWGYSETMSWSSDPAIRDSCQLTALPADRWAIFQERFTWLTELAREYGCPRIVMDSEIYVFTPMANRGRMDKRAWKDSPVLRERAKWYRQQFTPSLRPATWVYWDDGSAHAGFRFWWKEVLNGIGAVLYEESFYKDEYDPSGPIKKNYKAQPIPGIWRFYNQDPPDTLFKEMKEAADKGGSRTVWLYDEKGLLLTPNTLPKVTQAIKKLKG
jgi:hypothetical protein